MPPTADVTGAREDSAFDHMNKTKDIPCQSWLATKEVIGGDPVMLTLMITGSKKYTEKEIVPFFL
jgi:hypothetical protein